MTLTNYKTEWRNDTATNNMGDNAETVMVKVMKDIENYNYDGKNPPNKTTVKYIISKGTIIPALKSKFGGPPKNDPNWCQKFPTATPCQAGAAERYYLVIKTKYDVMPVEYHNVEDFQFVDKGTPENSYKTIIAKDVSGLQAPVNIIEPQNATLVSTTKQTAIGNIVTNMNWQARVIYSTLGLLLIFGLLKWQKII